MSDVIEQLAVDHGLLLCVECGKCVAVCPIGDVFDNFSYEVSPRGVIERILIDPELPEDDSLWFCLTCDLCTNLCPAGVRFRDFIGAVRQQLIEKGVTQYGSFCASCGTYLHPQHTFEYMKQTLGENTEELLRLCPSCRRYEIGGTLKMLLPGKKKISAQRTSVEDKQ